MFSKSRFHWLRTAHGDPAKNGSSVSRPPLVISVLLLPALNRTPYVTGPLFSVASLTLACYPSASLNLYHDISIVEDIRFKS